MKLSVISVLALGASFVVALPFWKQSQTHHHAARDEASNAGAGSDVTTTTETDNTYAVAATGNNLVGSSHSASE
ncbi:hypothetical protein RSAG8_08162, partial [Rhizoctonia solani AG-8 WAC10335]